MYIRRIADAPGPAGRLARIVKLADLEDHLAHPAIPSDAPPYAWARKQLLSARDRAVQAAPGSAQTRRPAARRNGAAEGLSLMALRALLVCERTISRSRRRLGPGRDHRYPDGRIHAGFPPNVPTARTLPFTNSTRSRTAPIIPKSPQRYCRSGKRLARTSHHPNWVTSRARARQPSKRRLAVGAGEWRCRSGSGVRG